MKEFSLRGVVPNAVSIQGLRQPVTPLAWADNIFFHSFEVKTMALTNLETKTEISSQHTFKFLNIKDEAGINFVTLKD